MDNKLSRYKAREQGFLLVFETMFNDSPLEELLESAVESREVSFDPYAVKIAENVLKETEYLDSVIEAHLKKGWTVNRISKVSLAILRLAVYEMRFEDKVPDSVAINEAVELAKKYTVDESKFINGVLGAISRK